MQYFKQCALTLAGGEVLFKTAQETGLYGVQVKERDVPFFRDYWA
jgi:hypothetical protein